MADDKPPVANGMNANGEIASLDGLRGIAALCIVLYHAQGVFAFWPPAAFLAGAFGKYYLFVDLFFVLSGLVIARSSARLFDSDFSARTYRSFMRARLIRLWPVHLVTLAILVVIELSLLWGVERGVFDPGFAPFDRPEANPVNLLTTAFMLQSWGFHDKLVWNVPSWFISALLFAYLAYPFVLRATRSLTRTSRAAFFVLTGGVLSLALHAAYELDYFAAPHDIPFIRALLAFMLGCGLSFLEPGKWDERLPYAQPALVVAILACFHLKAPDALSVFLLALFIRSLQFDKGRVAHALAARPFRFLSKISFSLYMTHFIGLFLIDSFGQINHEIPKNMFRDEAMGVNIAARFALLILFAWAFWRYVEEPMRRWMTRAPQAATALSAGGRP